MLRRSCLVVPGSERRMIEKAVRAGADEVIVDLEDAVAPTFKEHALANAVWALQELDFGGSTRSVRVNGVATPWCDRELDRLVEHLGAGVDAIVVPKVESSADVLHVAGMLRGHDVSLELLIESPRGVVDLREIVRASNMIDALVFGPGDFAASLGVANGSIGTIERQYPGHQWHWVMSEVAVHAAAADAQAIDGPYGDFRDREGFEEVARRARLLGYVGKWCIHPDQVAWANEAFTPTDREVEDARRILDMYDAAALHGRGTTQMDGTMIDEASRRAAESILARAAD